MSDYQINNETLISVLSKMFDTSVTCADYQIKKLHGGSIGEVSLITGSAKMAGGGKLPYSVVLKVQGKFKRPNDLHSWRREYDLYMSDLDSLFTDCLYWPKCYHAELHDDCIILWIEYIDGISGLNLTVEMYERAALELGRFQGNLYAEQPSVLQELPNLSRVDYTKKCYLRYRGWSEVYDYIRSDECGIPPHLREMLIGIDENSDSIFERIEKLPIVFCHRDFWVTNIFCLDGKIALIDWDTAGWGHMGEDIASLIIDEADIDNMVETYHKCVPAYYKGVSEYVDVSNITDHCTCELMLIMFGYKLVEAYKFTESADDKTVIINTFQKVYEMGGLKN